MNKVEKQKEFIKCINEGDYENLIALCEDEDINLGYANNWAIQEATERGYETIVSLLLKYKTVNPAVRDNYCIRKSVSGKNDNITKILLQDKRVDPSADENWAIWLAKNERKWDIVKLIWKDNRVKNSLEVDEPDLYNFLIKEDFKNNIKNF